MQAMLTPLAAAARMQQRSSTGQDKNQGSLPTTSASEGPVVVGPIDSTASLEPQRKVSFTSGFSLAIAIAVFLGGCVAILTASQAFQSLEPTKNNKVTVSQMPQHLDKKVPGGLREDIGDNVEEAADNGTFIESANASFETTRQKHPRPPQIETTVDRHRSDSMWPADTTGVSSGDFSLAGHKESYRLSRGPRVLSVVNRTRTTSARYSLQQQNFGA